MKETYLYCNAECRPVHCFLQTNLCCVVCIHQVECKSINRTLHSNWLPCTDDNIEYDDGIENCEYQI